jgi:hypothetical protein
MTTECGTLHSSLPTGCRFEMVMDSYGVRQEHDLQQHNDMAEVVILILQIGRITRRRTRTILISVH